VKKTCATHSLTPLSFLFAWKPFALITQKCKQVDIALQFCRHDTTKASIGTTPMRLQPAAQGFFSKKKSGPFFASLFSMTIFFTP
jgi:hypothetical protein